MHLETVICIRPTPDQANQTVQQPLAVSEAGRERENAMDFKVRENEMQIPTLPLRSLNLTYLQEEFETQCAMGPEA